MAAVGTTMRGARACLLATSTRPNAASAFLASAWLPVQNRSVRAGEFCPKAGVAEPPAKRAKRVIIPPKAVEFFLLLIQKKIVVQMGFVFFIST